MQMSESSSGDEKLRIKLALAFKKEKPVSERRRRRDDDSR